LIRCGLAQVLSCRRQLKDGKLRELSLRKPRMLKSARAKLQAARLVRRLKGGLEAIQVRPR